MGGVKMKFQNLGKVTTNRVVWFYIYISLASLMPQLFSQ